MIPLPRLKDCGFINFWSMPDTGWLADSVVYPSELGPPNWIYSLIQVDFERLAMRFPPRHGQTVRIGGDIILTDPALPHIERAGPAEPPGGGNVGVKEPVSVPVGVAVAQTTYFLDNSEPPDASSPRAASPPPPTQAIEEEGQTARRLKKVPPRRGDSSDRPAPSAVAAGPDHARPRRHLRTPEAAEYLSLSKSTLEKYRLNGGGPVYHKLGRICIYDVESLDAWIEASSRKSTSDSHN